MLGAPDLNHPTAAFGLGTLTYYIFWMGMFGATSAYLSYKGSIIRREIEAMHPFEKRG